MKTTGSSPDGAGSDRLGVLFPTHTCRLEFDFHVFRLKIIFHASAFWRFPIFVGGV
jgi:hypothetical protein